MKKLNLLKSLGIASMFLFALVLAAPNYSYAIAEGSACVPGDRNGADTSKWCNAGLACRDTDTDTTTTDYKCVKSTGVDLTADNTRQVGVLVSTELNQTTDLVGTISTVINWFLGFVGIIVFGIFLIAGFEYATAGGDAGKTETAQKRMTNAVIGMVILFFAFTASNTILSFVFGGVQTSSFQ